MKDKLMDHDLNNRILSFIAGELSCATAYLWDVDAEGRITNPCPVCGKPAFECQDDTHPMCVNDLRTKDGTPGIEWTDDHGLYHRLEDERPTEADLPAGDLHALRRCSGTALRQAQGPTGSTFPATITLGWVWCHLRMADPSSRTFPIGVHSRPPAVSNKLLHSAGPVEGWSFYTRQEIWDLWEVPERSRQTSETHPGAASHTSRTFFRPSQPGTGRERNRPGG